MIAGFLTSPSSFIRPWHLGQARTSTANVREKFRPRAVPRWRHAGGQPAQSDRGSMSTAIVPSV